ncbi:MAG: glycosyltransferase family 87 protein, partial [Candidatus Dormibacteria bacterium]
MLHRLLSPRNVVTVTAAMVLCYLAIWLGYDPHHRIDNDFISTYFGAWLLRGGHHADLYDPTVQRWAHDLLVGPTPPSEFFMPFVNVPIASVIALPVTLFSPAVAYMGWSTIQLALLAAAIVIAYRAAPRPAGRSTVETAGILLLVLSAYVTLDLPLAGQWDGLNALGVAMAYRCWRRDRYYAGGAWLVATMALAKPHLAIGLLAFILGWGNRRAIAGALTAGVSIAIASFALVGTSGVLGWIHLLGSDAHAWSVRGQSSFVALAGGWTGDGPLTFPITYAGTAVLAGLCLVLGRRLCRGR